MKTHVKAADTETQILTLPDTRISVENFGPIANGSVDLRPLTVFVGPSNTGKTYFAILIYALHQILNGFPRLPVMYQYRHRFGSVFRHGKSLRMDAELSDEEGRAILNKLDSEAQIFRFMDLPKSIRDVTQAVLSDPELLGSHLRDGLEHCFGLDSVSELVRLSGSPNSMNVSLNVSEEGCDLWHFGMAINKSGFSADGQIKDMVLLPEGSAASKSRSYKGFRRLLKSIKEELELSSPEHRAYLIGQLFEELLNVVTAKGRVGTHYLPAARSGIMQSHRVIASSLVANATRAGLERFPEIPTFSGVMADFMQRLILYEERHRRQSLPMRKLAKVLESDVLAGQIRTKRPSTGGYPEFVYRPRKSEMDIRLARASSMVSELAPVVLYLRGAIDRGDMLIIEEPEAHLHPGAQTEMAKTLGRLVRAGVQVVVTTHSDWLLMEIGNLIREGELENRIGEPYNEKTHPSSLQPSDVGVWLFRKDETSASSTVEEIPFDRIEGVEPREYEDVAEELYNRSAGLQNQLAETASGEKYRGE